MNLRRFFAIPVLTSFLFLGVFGFSGITRASDEVINSFDSDITMNKDGSVQVTETIVYNFGSNEKHGIYRDIPLTAKDGPRIQVNIWNVKDEKGEDYHYAVSTTDGAAHIKIGDPDVLVSGVRTYVIDYTVTNVIRPFEDHDEFYWNVTGNDWQVPITRAFATVSYPPGISRDQVRSDCFTGLFGSTEKNCLSDVSSSTSRYQTAIGEKPLGAGEGLTLVLGIPLGVVDDTVMATPPADDDIFSNMPWWFILFPVAFILIIFGMVASLFAWFARTRGYRGPVVTAYEPPDNLRPIDVGTLLDQRVDQKDISSIILDLAVRGYLKIRYTIKEIPFWPDKKDFELVKLKEGVDLTHPAEKIFFDILFGEGDTTTVSYLTLHATKFQQEFKNIVKETENYLHEEGYYDKEAKVKADALSKKLGATALGIFIVCFFLTFVFPSAAFFIVIPLVILGAIQANTVNGLAHQFTQKGQDAQAKAAGFREFLSLTEKDKLALLNAPALQPEMFEKFLPYAVVLGVEEKWAKKFEGIYAAPPTWYEDSRSHTFSSLLLMENMRLINTSFTNVVASSTPHSSSGFSGGSSGGGSGGGGGGSW